MSNSSFERAPSDKVVTVALYTASDGSVHIRSATAPLTVDEHMAIVGRFNAPSPIDGTGWAEAAFEPQLAAGLPVNFFHLI